ncbi:hypothetical protein Ciccas_000345 [Cichlidogyrus casuarinus]|uniref:Uncharacterized protein n=1 Tax=Cichlidogyrus casuarinus TaxID=1844966 RepID=A0ABD2QN80_9PLAT
MLTEKPDLALNEGNRSPVVSFGRNKPTMKDSIGPSDVIQVIRMPKYRPMTNSPVNRFRTADTSNMEDEEEEIVDSDSMDSHSSRPSSRNVRILAQTDTSLTEEIPAVWTIPRKPSLQSQEDSYASSAVSIETPGGMFLRRHHNDRPSNGVFNNLIRNNARSRSASPFDMDYKHERNSISEAGSASAASIKNLQQCRSELRFEEKLPSHCTIEQVYFRFDRAKRNGIDAGKIFNDFAKKPQLLIKLQAACRGWLARKRYKERQRAHEAILTIQDACAYSLDPWLNLFRNLKPVIRCQLTAKEITRLKVSLRATQSSHFSFPYANVSVFRSSLIELDYFTDELCCVPGQDSFLQGNDPGAESRESDL